MNTLALKLPETLPEDELLRVPATRHEYLNVVGEWLNHDYRTLEATVQLGDVALPRRDIYRKTPFSATT